MRPVLTRNGEQQKRPRADDAPPPAPPATSPRPTQCGLYAITLHVAIPKGAGPVPHLHLAGARGCGSGGGTRRGHVPGAAARAARAPRAPRALRGSPSPGGRAGRAGRPRAPGCLRPGCLRPSIRPFLSPLPLTESALRPAPTSLQTRSSSRPRRPTAHTVPLCSPAPAAAVLTKRPSRTPSLPAADFTLPPTPTTPCACSPRPAKPALRPAPTSLKARSPSRPRRQPQTAPLLSRLLTSNPDTDARTAAPLLQQAPATPPRSPWPTYIQTRSSSRPPTPTSNTARPSSPRLLTRPPPAPTPPPPQTRSSPCPRRPTTPCACLRSPTPPSCASTSPCAPPCHPQNNPPPQTRRPTRQTPQQHCDLLLSRLLIRRSGPLPRPYIYADEEFSMPTNPNNTVCLFPPPR